MTGTDQERSGGRIPPSRDTAAAAARAASSKQAQDIVVLNVSQLIVITDHFVICSAATQRQIKTVIEAVEEAGRALGVRPARREGEDGTGWWLLHRRLAAREPVVVAAP